MIQKSDDFRVLTVTNDTEVGRQLATTLADTDDRLIVDAYSEEVYTNGSLTEEFISQFLIADCIVSTDHVLKQCPIDFVEAVRAESPALPFVLLTESTSASEPAVPGDCLAAAIGQEITDWFPIEFVYERPESVATRIIDTIGGLSSHVQPREPAAQRTLEVCPDAVTVAVDGDFVYVNEAAVELLGASTRGELLDRPVSDVLHPENQEEILENMESITGRERVVSDRPRKLLTLDGRVIHVEVTARNVEWEDQQAVVAILHDVTERVRQQRELERQNEQFEQIAARLEQTVIWMATPDLQQTVYVSPGYESIWGRSTDSLYEDFESFLNGVHPDDQERIEEQLAQLRADAAHGDAQPEYKQEFRVCHPDGTVRWVENTTFPLRNGDEVIQWIGITTDITTRKEREQDLRQYQTVIKALDNPVWATDEEGNVTFVNQQFCESAGQPREALLGRPIHAVFRTEKNVAEEAATSLRDAVEAILRSEKDNAHRELEITHSDSSMVRNVQVVPLVEEGDITGAIGIDYDITEQKRQEEKRKQTIDRVTDAIVRVDDEWQFTFVDEQAEDYYEMTEEELLGRDFWEVFEGVRNTRFEDAYRHVMGTREPMSVEEYSSDLDDWFHVEVYPDDRGGLSFYFREITERKEREEELQMKTRAMEEAPIGILITDPSQDDNPIIYANTGFERLTGYTKEEILGRNCRFLQGEETDPEPVAAMRKAIDNQESVSVELRNYRKDGTRFWNHMTIAPITNDAGDVTHYVGFQEDVTERKEYEQTLPALHEATNDFIQASSQTEAAEQIADTVEMATGLSAVAVYHYDDKDGVLRPAASSTTLQELVGNLPVFGPGEGIAWRAFTTGESVAYDDIRTVDDVYNPETPIRSELIVPVGDHGVILAGSPELGAVTEYDRKLVELLALSAEAAINTIEQQTQLRARQQELDQRNQQLMRINKLNDIIRNINQILIKSDTPDTITQGVCDQLVEIDQIEFAWIAKPELDSQAVQPTAWSGSDRSYLDQLGESIGDEVAPDEPTVQAARTQESVSVPNIARQPSSDWQTSALQQGYSSVLSVPLIYEESFYGALSVYASDQQFFEEEYQDVMTELGKMTGLGINTINQRDALLGKQYTTITLQIDGVASSKQPFLNLSNQLGCEVELSTILSSKRGHIVYAQIQDVTATDVIEFAEKTSEINHARQVQGTNHCETEPCLFEFLVRETCLAIQIADQGGVPKTITFNNNRGRVIADLPPTVEPATLIESLQSQQSSIQLVSTSTQQNPIESSDIFNQDSSESPNIYILQNDLTSAQREAVEAAYAGGFFEWPRDSTGEEIADVLGISQPAFSERLRAAQRKIIAAYCR
ncbi:PAS domain S-box protein [Salarchaeum sp. JOR-1]|uniref:PAS domain S-box protein n=1 Tax=Salarchaeum sp. JOR-1 TaxID=2599399 RepID=UPI0011985EB1|nr:PAS domain S-box protein [Salarchaeum sp. JOR-1]QDX39520.1 PAS domain S-box protein [Salarchaeum sp. JOR-1]